ncbi:hypothetical protein Riv7116_5180 [Rivularia sp. PCC 7116]|nr:hypothetical protein Riv7116_5180 [Rivularia sp. PCC 7116]
MAKRVVLEISDSTRILYLALPVSAYETFEKRGICTNLIGTIWVWFVGFHASTQPTRLNSKL